jgi:hypothetical protein
MSFVDKIKSLMQDPAEAISEDVISRVAKPTGDIVSSAMSSASERLLKNSKPLSRGILPSAAWGTLAAGEAALLGRMMGLSKRTIIPAAAASFAMGTVIPAAINGIRDNINSDEYDKEKVKDIFKSFMSGPSQIQEKLEGLMTKKSALTPIVVKSTKKILAGGGVLGKSYLKGLRKTPKNAPLGEKVFGGVAKGTAMYGAYVGGSKLYKGLKDKKGSKRDYTTFLRNNMLAQNIRPSELSQVDHDAVIALGMK